MISSRRNRPSGGITTRPHPAIALAKALGNESRIQSRPYSHPKQLLLSEQLLKDNLPQLAYKVNVDEDDDDDDERYHRSISDELTLTFKDGRFNEMPSFTDAEDIELNPKSRDRQLYEKRNPKRVQTVRLYRHRYDGKALRSFRLHNWEMLSLKPDGNSLHWVKTTLKGYGSDTKQTAEEGTYKLNNIKLTCRSATRDSDADGGESASTWAQPQRIDLSIEHLIHLGLTEEAIVETAVEDLRQPFQGGYMLNKHYWKKKSMADQLIKGFKIFHSHTAEPGPSTSGTAETAIEGDDSEEGAYPPNFQRATDEDDDDEDLGQYRYNPEEQYELATLGYAPIRRSSNNSDDEDPVSVYRPSASIPSAPTTTAVEATSSAIPESSEISVEKTLDAQGDTITLMTIRPKSIVELTEGMITELELRFTHPELDSEAE